MNPSVSGSLRNKLRRCQTKDAYRFLKKIRRHEKSKSPKKELAKQYSELSALIANSISIVESKEHLIPNPIKYPKGLPVSAKAAEIRGLLENNQVIIVSGDTGSGKTTQLPKICLDAGYGRRGLIGHCQPRRLAATSVASRIAEELNSPIGALVGFQVRFNERISESCCVKLMTDGILLSEIQSDAYLSKYEVIIVDEAHERSLNIDFLLGFLKRLLNKRKELKVIITSATIDVEKFSSHFNDAGIIAVEGRTFPVETRYSDINLTNDERELNAIEHIVESVASLVMKTAKDTEQNNDILVFLSSEREIRETAKNLRKKKFTNSKIFPLYSRLPQSEQNKIFQKHRSQRIILSTNVAETSITVPGIKYVVDTGLARISRYSFQSKVQRLPIERVSQASANQRKGRCGRVEEGICVRLYSEDDFNARPLYTDPEITRTNLAAVILRMLSLDLGDVFDFPFVDKPETKSINEGFKLLTELNAVSGERRLTSDGRLMAALPVDPKYAKMLIVASSKNCLKELLIIVSALSIQDPREKDFVKLDDESSSLELFEDKNSDFLALTNLWLIYDAKRKSSRLNFLRGFCKKHGLSFFRMREWREVHLQLTLTCRKLGLKINKDMGSYENIHKSIIAGSLNQIAYKISERHYVGSRNKKFVILKSSILSKTQPKWIVTGELIETSQTFAAIAAKISTRWVEEMALHLIKREVFDPHWSVKGQRVQAFEKVRLYGLTIIEKAVVDYKNINPTGAREIFINDGLSKNTIKTTAAFYKSNKKFLESVQGEEEKLRRPEALFSESDVSYFYSQVLPEHISSTKELENWVKCSDKTALERVTMVRENLINPHDREYRTSDFPDKIVINKNNIFIDYAFEPGSKKDGATVKIPIQILNQLNDTDIDWAVPGIIREKCIALLKGLPKTLRKQLIPINTLVDDIIPEFSVLKGSLIQCLSDSLYEKRRLVVPTAQLSEIRLPDHLIVKVEVLDLDGKSIGVGTSIEKLKETLVDQDVDFKVEATDYTGESKLLELKNLVDWGFDELPEKVEINDQVVMVRYPAIVDDLDSVSLQLFSESREALANTRLGLLRLYLLKSVQQRNLIKKKFSKYLKESALLIPPNISNFTDDLIHATYVNAFSIRSVIPRFKSEFDQQLNLGKSQLFSKSEEIIKIVKEIFKERLEILRDLSQFRDTNLLYFYEDVSQQVDNLMTEKLFIDVDIARLKHFPRYLRGIKIRLKRAPYLGSKDLQFTEEIAKYWSQYEDLRQVKSLDECNQLSEIRWMIEEYRVSLFAQSLGTSIPISAKRIEKAINLLNT